MTCIVAVADKGIVTIGGDSAASGGPFMSLRADRKVFRKDNFVMGFTTSFRMGQLLRWSMQIADRPRSMSGEEYMTTWFVTAARICLKDGGFARVNMGVEEGGQFLVGYEGAIYEFHSDFQCGLPVDSYSACGCGENLALGALRATERLRMPARQRVLRALDAATHFSGAVAPPFHLLATRP